MWDEASIAIGRRSHECQSCRSMFEHASNEVIGIFGEPERVIAVQEGIFTILLDQADVDMRARRRLFGEGFGHKARMVVHLMGNIPNSLLESEALVTSGEALLRLVSNLVLARTVLAIAG